VKYYPAFLNLADKPAIVIGGGAVAERKVRSLVEAGAAVKVISPDITKNLQKLKQKGLITHLTRNYRRGDAGKAFVVVACTSSSELNDKIAREAMHLVNVITEPDKGNYIVPSTVKRGPLTIAVSTGGISPALSKTIRKELQYLYNREFSLYVKFIESIRQQAIKKIADNKKREKFLKSLASRSILDKLRTGSFQSVYKKVLADLNKIG
jgi:precorrin-2 dehydrogenase/sirohydrochlorin ferrochelatase